MSSSPAPLRPCAELSQLTGEWGRSEFAGRAIIGAPCENLTKGTSGQAVQNMNLMLGFPETMGSNRSRCFSDRGATRRRAASRVGYELDQRPVIRGIDLPIDAHRPVGGGGIARSQRR
jgi:hypothetical protein